MGAVFLSEIIALVILIVGVMMGGAGCYLLLRHFHRKWKWEDEVHKNQLLREAMQQAGLRYEVNDKGFVQPLGGASEPRSSGRAHD
jgi:hypothetical protein